MRKEEAKEVGIWVRVSTDQQVESESPEHHLKRAEMYAEAKGWKVARTYELAAVSGKTVMGNAETDRMMDDIRQGRISGLIFSKLARLARNTKELLEFADFFQVHDADLISLHESIDTSTPVGRFFYTLIAGMAQWEREEIAERVAASVPIRAKLGKPLGGQAPFGYQWTGGEMVPDPSEAPVRKLIYELFAKERRLKTVARLLNDQGHRTRRGAKFSDTTVRRLIEDPTAKGKRRANYTRSAGEGKHWTLKPESEWVWHDIEPVVTETLWTECNHFLAERKRGKKPAKKPRHPFAGVVFCHCGQKMYVPSNTPKYVCYECRNKIPVADLDHVFQDRLQSFLLSPNEIAEAMANENQLISEKRELLESMKREQKKTRAEMDRMVELYLADELPAKGFGDRYKPMEEREEELLDEIPRLEGEIDFLRIRHLASEDIFAEARNLYAEWHKRSDAEKRRVVENVVERITIGDAEITIELTHDSFPPPDPKGLPPTPETVAEWQRCHRRSSPRRAESDTAARRHGHRERSSVATPPAVGAGIRAPAGETRATRRETTRHGGPG